MDIEKYKEIIKKYDKHLDKIEHFKDDIYLFNYGVLSKLKCNIIPIDTLIKYKYNYKNLACYKIIEDDVYCVVFELNEEYFLLEISNTARKSNKIFKKSYVHSSFSLLCYYEEIHNDDLLYEVFNEFYYVISEKSIFRLNFTLNKLNKKDIS